MENRLMELWSLLSIVAPGLYPWPQRFQELVAVPVERLGDRDVLARFRRRIRPFLLRRTKEHVAADLPAKQEQVLEVSLTPRHRTVYDTHLQRERQTVLGLVDEFDKHRIAIFRSLTRLRQLSLDAGLVDEAYDGIGSAKVDVLVDHLLELARRGTAPWCSASSPRSSPGCVPGWRARASRRRTSTAPPGTARPSSTASGPATTRCS
jgi:SNF2 family DNA or RNA helicase